MWRLSFFHYLVDFSNFDFWQSIQFYIQVLFHCRQLLVSYFGGYRIDPTSLWVDDCFEFQFEFWSVTISNPRFDPWFSTYRPYLLIGTSKGFTKLNTIIFLNRNLLSIQLKNWLHFFLNKTFDNFIRILLRSFRRHHTRHPNYSSIRDKPHIFQVSHLNLKILNQVNFTTKDHHLLQSKCMSCATHTDHFI